MAHPLAGISPIPQYPQLAQTAAGSTSSTAGVSAGSGASGEKSDFFHTLGGVMDEVGGAQSDAQTKVQEMLAGNGQDLHTAMIAVEKADLSFQLMMQVRNKIIQAYQTVSQMQF
jgi:flagellar hook-basal body complex protein FliE